MSCKLLRRFRPASGIYVINQSTLVADSEVKKWTAACSRQIREHVAPAYAMAPVKVSFLSAADHAPAGAWVLTVMDDGDQAGALGWHTSDEAGRIYGRVFVRPCIEYNVPLSTTGSHEIVETFVDPKVNRWADTGRGYSVPWEACDPVEGDSYEIDGVLVSDFVLPAWFTPSALPGAPLHWLDNGNVPAPFALAPGGYVVRRWPGGTEDQEYGARANRGYINAKRSTLARTARRMPTSYHPER